MSGSESLPQRLYKAETGTLIWSEPLASGDQAVVKLYRRRARFEPLRRRFIRWRVEREFRLLRLLSAHGVACSEPLAWSRGRCRTHGCYERLETREVPGAMPLTQRLAMSRLPDLTALFALARRMHRAGVAHGAFYARNVLVADGPEPAFHVIDLAHGRAFGRDIAGSRPADYDLLDMLKSISRQAPAADARDWLVAGYGMTPGRAARLCARLARYRSGRPWRHLRRIETDARALLAALVTFPAASRASP